MWRKKMDKHLSTSSDAEKLACEVLNALQNSDKVILDFSSTEVITPSFVNTFVFTLCEKIPFDQLRSRCELAHRNTFVLAAFSSAISRFNRGIRLSGQLLEPA